MPSTKNENLGKKDTGLETDLKSLVSTYETKIVQLATDLIGDEEKAKKLSLHIFTKLNQEISLHPEEDIETLVHRVTYELSLPMLVQNRASQKIKHTVPHKSKNSRKQKELLL